MLSSVGTGSIERLSIVMALLLNLTALPRAVQARLFDLGLLCAAGLFYLGLAVLYFVGGT